MPPTMLRKSHSLTVVDSALRSMFGGGNQGRGSVNLPKVAELASGGAGLPTTSWLEPTLVALHTS